MDWYCTKLVHPQLTLMAAATSSDNNAVAGLAAETYVAVNMQLVGCNMYV